VRLLTRVAPAASAVVLLAAAPASGHRVDEYLQAIRVDIGVDRILVESDLTPGANLAADVLSTLDSNGDGAIGADEEQVYVAAFLARLEVSIDGGRRTLSPVSGTFPAPGELLDGAGVIRLVLTADADGIRGARRLVVRNLFRPDVGVYLANALRPTARGVTISAQQRDPKQQQLHVDYLVETHPLTPRAAVWGLVAAVLLGLNVWWRQRNRGLLMAELWLRVGSSLPRFRP
jgi:hypothetical protein